MSSTTQQLPRALPLAFSIVFLLGLACCFCSYLGNVPCSKLCISVFSTKQELVQIDPSFVQLLLNTKELLTWICEEQKKPTYFSFC